MQALCPRRFPATWAPVRVLVLAGSPPGGGFPLPLVPPDGWLGGVRPGRLPAGAPGLARARGASAFAAPGAPPPLPPRGGCRGGGGLRRAGTVRHGTAAAVSSGTAGGGWELPPGSPPAAQQLEEKRSRFVALAGRAESTEAALAFVEANRQPGASHNCWAFKVGAESRSTDDGEPSGTAGRPILAALEAEGVNNACVLVVRYYGGTKLGTGGLARAYGGAARLVLQRADKVWVRPEVRLSVRVTFEDIGAIHAAIRKLGGAHKEAEHFDEAGARLEVRLEESLVEQFTRAVRDVTGGRAKFGPAEPA